MNQSKLSPAPGSRRDRKRVGRGPGSGNGKTAGRGEKGQKSRSGYSAKRGFTNIFRKEFRTVNVERLNDLPAGSTVTPESLQLAGLLKKGALPVKILGNGEIKVALTVRAHKYTASAAQKIEAAGGKAEVIS